MQEKHSTFEDSPASSFFFVLRDVLGLMSCDATYVKGHACPDFYASVSAVKLWSSVS